MPHPRLSPDALIIRKTQLNRMSLSLCVMGRHFLPTSILQKVVIILPWTSSEGPRCVFSWPATGKGKPLQLALLFYTTAGRKLNECGLKRPREGKE
jgi:hypothetical protein